MKYSPLWQLSLSKVRGILREPEAIFWVVVFPVLLSVALGIAFRASGPPARDALSALETRVGHSHRWGWTRRAPAIR